MLSKTTLLALAASLALAAPAFAASTGATSQASADQANGNITQAYAKTQITDDDYTNVTNLQKTSNGWTANAETQGKPVALWVSKTGTVQVRPTKG